MGKEAELWAEGRECPALPELDCLASEGDGACTDTRGLCRPGAGPVCPSRAGHPWTRPQGIGKDPAHLGNPPGPDPSCVGRKKLEEPPESPAG